MAIERFEFEFPEPDDAGTLDVEPALNRMNTFEDNPAKAEPEVEVIDDTPAEDRGRVASEPPDDVTDDELQSYSEKVRRRIKHFSKGYHDKRREAEQALREKTELETYAQKIIAENNALKGTVAKNQEAMLEHVKHMAASEFEEAKTRFKHAYDAGDSDGVVAAQEALTAARLKIDKVNNIKLQEPTLQEERIPVKASSQPAPDAKAQNWQAQNTWFGEDDEMTSLALGLHQKLVKQGVDPTSDSYYEKINSRMRELFPDRFSSGEERSKHRSTVVASATRSTAPRKITLTTTQVALAKRLGVPLQEYARQVALEMRGQSNG